MYQLPSYFMDFLKAISLTELQSEECKTSHKELRELLKGDEKLKNALLETFIQGSYARRTINQPTKGKLPDVDLIIVTRLSEEIYTPDQALDYFQPFLESHYSGKYRKQGRSWGIELDNVGLDFVVTSAPTEAFEGLLSNRESFSQKNETKPLLFEFLENLFGAFKDEEWKELPLRIPDREANEWVNTHPIEQKKWTVDKNGKCSGHFIHVVRAIKWWRQINDFKYKAPKGYPLEHIVGFSCPDDITSVAEGITYTLENIVSQFRDNRARYITPVLPDHGAPDHNVLGRIKANDFAKFYDDIVNISHIARSALEAESIQETVEIWRKIFGDLFPPYQKRDNDNRNPKSSARTGLYSPRKKNVEEEISGGRFA